MKKLVFTLLCVLLAGAAVAQEKLCIASQGKTASIVVDNADWKGVIIAARNLADDVRKVTGTAALLRCRIYGARRRDAVAVRQQLWLYSS